MKPLLLMTGAAGRVGQALRPLLGERYRLRLLDRLPIEDTREDEEVMIGDLSNWDFVSRSVTGVDGVLHLACAHGTELAFEASLDPNYRATLYLLEACRQNGIERFLFASSHHVRGQYPVSENELDERAPLAPDGIYALSKVFGEAAGSLYAWRHGMQVMNIRIGNVDPTVTDPRRRRIWVSARDLAQLIEIGMTQTVTPCATVYGISRCAKPLFDNGLAETLGYEPQDDAEAHIDSAYRYAEQLSADEGLAFAGGAYAASGVIHIDK